MPALRLTLKPLCRPGEHPAHNSPNISGKAFLFAALAAAIFLSSIFWRGTAPTAAAIPV